MKFRLSLLSLLVGAHLAFLPQLVVSGSSRIVGGTTSKPYPYYALLQFHTGEGVFQCGGSLIYEDIVLTAAHCYDSSTTSIDVVLNATNIQTLSGYEVVTDVPTVLVHPSYDSNTQQNDIMLMELRHTVRSITPVQLNSNPSVPSTSDEAHVFGFGTTSFGGSSSSKLLVAEVDVTSNSQCVAEYAALGIADVDPAIMMCAAAPGKDSCQGDSGGPLVFDRFGEPDLQLGVISFGYGCAHPEASGVYTRVSAFSSWIQDGICELAYNKPSYCASGGGGGGAACNDSPSGWYDSWGSQYDCAYYAEGNNCGTFGHSFANFGATANQACCSCGGGASSTSSGGGGGSSGTCSDSPPAWYDSAGDDCAWYAEDADNCDDFGDDYANSGTTANKACCVCGGGTATSSAGGGTGGSTVLDTLGLDGCSTSSPCGACQGDCDSDAECAGSLKCFGRDSGSTTSIPGCTGSGTAGWDYCYDDGAGAGGSSTTLDTIGLDGCSTSSPCGACQGDCDSDAECAGSLECFSRSGSSTQNVPGCSGTGTAGWDYCYAP